MDRSYALKRAFANRFAMTAVLFLAITLWGSCTVLSGVLTRQTACRGYALPWEERTLSKGEPGLPHRLPTAASADLRAAAPTTPWPQQLRAQAVSAEAAVTQALEEDRNLIQLYGAYQALVDRTVVEDTADPQYSVARLEDGSLSFVGREVADPQVQAAELERLKLALDRRDVGLLYLQAPSKLEPGASSLPYGVTDPSNACADRLLAQLEERGVDCLDLRQTLAEAGGDWTDWFYKTDHHWTVRAAFVAFQAVAERLEEYDQTLPAGLGTQRRPIRVPERYTDPDAYEQTTLPSFFLGSQGKRVGSLYAGADDFQLWSVPYPTLFRYDTGHDAVRYGDWSETLLFSQRVEKRDYFGDNPYDYYSGGDYAFAQITNYYNPQGPRILLVRDSYACAITPYLALASSRLITVDPRHFEGDLLACVDAYKPDVVLVLYSSGMVRGETYYRLLAQSAAPSKADVLRWKDDWYEPDQT